MHDVHAQSMSRLILEFFLQHACHVMSIHFLITSHQYISVIIIAHTPHLHLSITPLRCTLSSDCEERTAALSSFHTDAAGDALVLNKWFGLQASADLPDLLSKVRELKKHPGNVT